MPVEQTDNTRVELSPRINPLKPIKVHQICRNRVENLERIKKAKINKY